MKKFIHPVYLSIIIGITLAFVFALSTHAQKVVRHGNVFYEEVDSMSRMTQAKIATLTGYKYVDKTGNMYPIYVSNGGKLFIKKVSKKSGKEYRRYLPALTEELKNEIEKWKQE